MLLLFLQADGPYGGLKAIVNGSLLSALVVKLLCGMLLDLTVHYGE